jgi:hypothetical protein
MNRQVQLVLGLKEADLWTVENIPGTTCKLVALNLEKWLMRQAGEHEECLQFCLRKLGILSGNRKKGYNPTEARERWRLIGEEFRTLEALQTGLAAGDWRLKACLKDRFDFTGLDSCGVKAWALLHPYTNTACYNRLFFGGRCLNENPYDFGLSHALDIDISAAYGNRLVHALYPVGLPTCWSHSNNQTRMTLGQWLDKNRWGDPERCELVDGLWCAVVKGKLSFRQDLLFSKVLKGADVRRAAMKWEQEDDARLASQTAMLRQELLCGLLTSSLLRAIQAIASNQEWGEIRNLKLETAVAYRQSDRRTDVQAWCEAVLAHQGAYEVVKNAAIEDNRSRAWFGIPLKGFSGKLAELRAEQEAIAKDESRPQEQREGARALAQMYKTNVNTVFGDIASRHFPVGNTVVGNNVTADVRLAVWMMAKALGLRQTITDGAIYSPTAVPFYKGRKPGLERLATLWTAQGGWQDARGGKQLGWQALGGLNWANRWEELTTQIKQADRLALEHIEAFWRPYGLTFEFDIRHKPDHTAVRAAYFNKGDYGLLVSDQQSGERKFKQAVRGQAKNPKPGHKEHPKVQLLRNACQGSDEFPDDLTYTKKGGILTIARWKQLQGSPTATEQEKALRPGDNQPDKTLTARFNNLHMPLETLADLQRRLQRQNRKTLRGQWHELFERYRDRGITGVVAKMTADKL